MSDQAKRYSFPELFNEANEIVRGKFVFKRFIDGTPLANDIPVWMTEFARDKIVDIAALEQRCRELEAEMHSANCRLHEVAVGCATAEQERDSLRATITAARDKLGPPIRSEHPALIEQAAADVLEMLEAAL